jgi:DNA-binding MurR/RpiR family transcriptional regulator
LVIAEGFLDASMRSIETLRSDLDGNNLARAVRILERAETIYVISQRRSYPLSAQLGYILGKLRIKCVIAGTVSDIDRDQLSLATKRDAAHAFSFTPYGSSTLDWARILFDNGVPIVGITDSPLAPLAELSKVCIEIAEADYVGFRGLAATSAIASALAVAVARKRQKNATRSRDKQG